MSYGVFDIAKDAIKGQLEFASPELRQTRILKCELCDELSQRFRQCKVCKCLVDEKVKFKKAECPLKKW